VAPAVEVPASLAALSLVYVLWPLLCAVLGVFFQLSVMAEELPSAHRFELNAKHAEGLDIFEYDIRL